MVLKVGFIGAGFMGQLAHLHCFKKVEECEVAALAEVRPKLGEAAAREYHIPRFYSSHQELLEDPSIEAVVCSQPYHRNFPLGREVLQAGKHLLTEKPMAARLDEAKHLVNIAEEKNVLYAVGFMKRFDPGVQLAERIIRENENTGRLGRLKMVDTTCFLGNWLQNPGRPFETDEPVPESGILPRYPDFLPESLESAYDNFLNIYSHNINLVHFLLGDSRLSCRSVDREGDVFLVGFRAGEAPVSLRGGFSRSYRWEEKTVFYYEGGRLEIESATPLNRQKIAEVTLFRGEGDAVVEERYHPPIEWAFQRQAQAFVKAAKRGEPLPTEGKHCLAEVELMQEVFRILSKK